MFVYVRVYYQIDQICIFPLSSRHSQKNTNTNFFYFSQNLFCLFQSSIDSSIGLYKRNHVSILDSIIIIMSLASIKQQQGQQSFTPLHVCITGSSQGIGLAAAQRLIQNGHVVYHACRNKERAHQAVKIAGGGIPMVCDLADFRSVRRFAQTLDRIAPKLDVLCLNAGIAPASSIAPSSSSTSLSTTTSPPPPPVLPKLTQQGYEECVGVNHLGHFLLANLLVNKLSQHGGGRLVVTASSVHDPATKGGRSGQEGLGATLGDLSGLGVDLRRQQGPTKKEKEGEEDRPCMVDGSTTYHTGKVYKDSKLCNVLMSRRAVHEFPPSVSTVAFNPGLVPTTGLFASLRNENPWKARALTWIATLTGVAVPLQVAGDRLVYMATATIVDTTTTTTMAADENDETQARMYLTNGSYFSAPVKCRGTTPADGFVQTAVSEDASNDLLAKTLWEKSWRIVQDWI